MTENQNNLTAKNSFLVVITVDIIGTKMSAEGNTYDQVIKFLVNFILDYSPLHCATSLLLREAFQPEYSISMSSTAIRVSAILNELLFCFIF